MTVAAVQAWPSNAELIADCAALGYLKKEWATLDPTYGMGVFWKLWRPDVLLGTDIDASKSPYDGRSHDFTNMPWDDKSFDCVVYDPPYKLNGRPNKELDERYGVHEAASWRERIALLRAGLRECARVCGDGFLLVKCQDQVCSGKVRWQTDELTDEAKKACFGKVDRLDRLGGRPQPTGKFVCQHDGAHPPGECTDKTWVPRRQVHATHNYSTLLVFKRGWTSGTSD